MRGRLFDNQEYRIKYDRYAQNKSSFSKTYQIIWITSGQGSINISGHKLEFVGDTVFYIPISTTYTIDPIGSVELIKIYFPKRYITISSSQLNTMFNINNINVKQHLATFIFKYNKRADFSIVNEGQKLIENILPYAQATEMVISPVGDSRVLDCIEYIEQHISSRFSVTEIADSLHINPTYLSTIFKNEVGTTIVKYTNNLRLEAAISDIRLTNHSITQIAYTRGFADVRTLNELIKSKYNLTPMQIRARVALGQHDELGTNRYNILIEKYKMAVDNNTIHQLEIDADANNLLGEYKSSFNCIAIGRAHDILYQNVQEQLITAKKELKFKYCRFHNIFGDEMNVIDTDYLGKEAFNFSKPFRVIEFLLDNDIIPFIELGFFPKQIAADSNSAFTGYNIHIGGEINYELWTDLIREFFTSLKLTFPNSYKEMRFDFWNEVDIKAFWPNPKQDFYKLYELTYHTIKEIDPDLLIGGFNYGNFISDTKAIEEDLNYCKDHNMLPDFLTIHSYPLFIDGDLSHNPDLAIEHLKPTYVKDKLNQDIAKLIYLREKYGFSEVYITEWNTSPMQREHLNDSTYKSSKIISEILGSNSSLIDGICYWTLSDEMAEFGYPLGEVHGGFGLFTRSGIAKPAYYGYMFASRLHGHIIHQTDNSIIVENDSGYVILINNGVDYDRNYYITNFGTEAQIMEGNMISAHINLSNLKPGLYSKNKLEIDTNLNLKPGFDMLSENKPYLTNSDLNNLKELTKLKRSSRLVPIADTFETTVNIDQTCTTLISLKRQ